MPASAQRTPTCCLGGRRASATPKMTTRSTVTTHVRCEVAHRTRPNLAVAWATRDGRSRCTCPVFLQFVCVLAEIRNHEALALQPLGDTDDVEYQDAEPGQGHQQTAETAREEPHDAEGH